jgi:hypothetical protein
MPGAGLGSIVAVSPCTQVAPTVASSFNANADSEIAVGDRSSFSQSV